MKLCFISTGVFALGLLSGCYEPPYRYDVRGNGQGGVEIQKVPKDTQPSPTATPTAVSPVVQPVNPEQQRINELESRVRALSAENEKLKRQPTTAASTTPVKE